MIILDTNVISETQRLVPNPKVLAWLNAQTSSNLYLTAISVGELTFGVHCLDPGVRFQRLLNSITTIIEDDFRGRILSFNNAAARMYGQQIGQARRTGITISQADGQIAAIAMVNRGAVIASRDWNPFHALGMAVVNPWE